MAKKTAQARCARTVWAYTLERTTITPESHMPNKRSDKIRLLEAELELIEGGGCGLPAGEPMAERPMFYHSLVCINHWQVPGHGDECHDNCVLLDAVPEGHRDEKLPCHFIPLNSAGDTVQALEQGGDRERTQDEVKKWLRATIASLKAEAETDGEESAPY